MAVTDESVEPSTGHKTTPDAENQPTPSLLTRLKNHLQPLKLTADGEHKKLSRPPIVIAFAVVAIGLLVTLLPVRLDQFGLGELADGTGHGFIPALCFIAGDLCLAIAVWRAAAAARDRPLEGLLIFCLGAIAASLTGACLRTMIQLVFLRDFYRPALFFSGAAGAAAVGWGGLLTLVLLAGFLAPALVAVANVIPPGLAKFAPPVSWLAARRSCLLWPFAALALVMIVTQWVLPAPLETAMGYRYLTPSGGVVTFSLRDLGPSAWASLQILFALPLVVLMWEGVESARTCQRLVQTRKGEQTRLLKALLRTDARIAAAVAVLGCGLLAVTQHSGPAGVAGVILLTVVALSFTGKFGRGARLVRGFEHSVQRWQMPEEWRDLGRFSLILAVLIAPPAWLLLRDIGAGAQSALWLPSDLAGFYQYWRSFGIVAVPSVTASGIYGHADSEIWIGGVAVALFLLFGAILHLLTGGGAKTVRDGWPTIWFLLRVGAFGLLLAPIAGLADHSTATTLLTGCAVVAILLTFDKSTRQAAAWSVLVAGAALAVWSFVLWHLTWLPAAVMVGLTVIQRFVYNAGELNTASLFRPQRVAYFQSIALLSVAMLALGHGAAAGYFDSEDLSLVSDRVSLSIVAVIWLVMLTVQQVRNEQKKKSPIAASGILAGPASGGTRHTPALPGQAQVKDPRQESSDSESDDDLPASWSWLLNPHLRLVAFTGRDSQLATLTDWLGRRGAARLRLVTGPGGCGKTRLALELCDRARALGWVCVWIPRGADAGAISALWGGSVSQALFVIDNADLRPGLDRMIARLATTEGEGMRVLLLARSTGEWCRRLGAASPGSRDLVSNALRQRLDLPATLRADKTDTQIVGHAVSSIARAFGLRESSVNVRRLKAQKPELIIELLAEALAATLTDAGLAETGTGSVQVDLRQRLDPLLRHEQEFWYESARHNGLLDGKDDAEITPETLRHVVAVSCLLGAESVLDATALATRILGVGQQAKLADWLSEICAASRSWTTPDGIFHPSRLAELLTLRELTASSDLLQDCLTGMTASQAVRATSFLARAFRDYSEAATLLSSVLRTLHDGISDSGDTVQTVSAALSVIPGPGGQFATTVVILIRRLLGCLPLTLDPAARSYWLEELSRWLGSVGDRAQAVRAADDAVCILRDLIVPQAESNLRPRQLARLVLATENLAEHLKAQQDQVRRQAVLREAMAFTRELVTDDKSLYGPWLARLLVSANASASDPALWDAATGEAIEAVALYRQASQARPGLYEPDLGQALEVLSFRYLESDHPTEAIEAGSQALTIYEQLLAAGGDQYRPDLARVLDNQGVYLARTGQRELALTATQQAVSEYGKLRRSRPGQFKAASALALEHLANTYQSLGQSARAAAARQQAADLRAPKNE